MWLPCKDTCIQYTFIFGLLERSKKQYIFEINFREMKGAGREGERDRETSTCCFTYWNIHSLVDSCYVP